MNGSPRSPRARARARSCATGCTWYLVGAPNVGKSSSAQSTRRRRRCDRGRPTPARRAMRSAQHRRSRHSATHHRYSRPARDLFDEVEKIGIERTRTAIAMADLAIIVTDARDLEPAPAVLVAELPAALARIVVRNKIDLAVAPPKRAIDSAGQTIWLSAKPGPESIYWETRYWISRARTKIWKARSWPASVICRRSGGKRAPSLRLAASPRGDDHARTVRRRVARSPACAVGDNRRVHRRRFAW